MTTSEVPPKAKKESEELPWLKVGEVISVGGLSHGRLMALATADRIGSDDPVHAALDRSLRINHPDIDSVQVSALDVDPASSERRYALVRVRDLETSEGETRDVVVMRGELEAVIGASKGKHSVQTKSLMRRNAARIESRGGRPLGVAAAAVADDGTVGDFILQGVIGVHKVDTHRERVVGVDASWNRVYMWSASLRIQHWLNVALILVLSLTGYYIMDPFFGPTGDSGGDTGYLMGWVRVIHFTAAFAWLLVGITRLVVLFTSRDRYLRWRVLWPLKSRKDFRNLGLVLQHYALIKKEAPLFLAHNPLQQLAYTFIYIMGGLQMATGFALYGLYRPDSPFWQVVSMPVEWFGAGPLRLVHAVVMFMLWAFVIAHVYMAVRADSLERHGGVSSIINGGVWLRRGSKPVDAPEIE
ncbi:MAG: Ni/Fe-hydrogenase, b-type cytochrome subunit [Micrococcales bacterium]|nr:Ni/Fe-hydrogenase, b-type cytochrome subunit [Micrococcales bacterium]